MADWYGALAAEDIPDCKRCGHEHHYSYQQCNAFVKRDGAWQQCECGSSKDRQRNG